MSNSSYQSRFRRMDFQNKNIPAQNSQRPKNMQSCVNQRDDLKFSKINIEQFQDFKKKLSNQQYSNPSIGKKVEQFEQFQKDSPKKEFFNNQSYLELKKEIVKYYYRKQKFQQSIKAGEQLVSFYEQSKKGQTLYLKMCKFMSLFCEMMRNQFFRSKFDELKLLSYDLFRILKQSKLQKTRYEMEFIMSVFLNQQIQYITRMKIMEGQLLNMVKKQFKVEEFSKMASKYFLIFSLKKKIITQKTTPSKNKFNNQPEINESQVNLNVGLISEKQININTANKNIPLLLYLPKLDCELTSLPFRYIEAKLVGEKKTAPFSFSQILKDKIICNLYIRVQSFFVQLSSNTDCWLKLFKGTYFYSVGSQEWNNIVSNNQGVAIKYSPQINENQLSADKNLKETMLEYQRLLRLNERQEKLTKSISGQDKKTTNNGGYKNVNIHQPIPEEIEQVEGKIVQIKKSNRGIKNIGSTCYMNSALQCLHKSKHFTTEFSQLFKQIKRNHPDRQYELSQQVKIFIQKMWQNDCPYEPYGLQSFITKINPIFKLYKQNDSVEWLVTLLSALGEELNKKLQKQQIVIDYQKETQSQIYQKTKKKQKMLKNSIIEQIFDGIYRVQFQCANRSCNKKTIRFQKFRVHYIQIPDPSDRNTYSYLNVNGQYQPRNYMPIKKQSLKNCLQNFSKVEHLYGENALNCNFCNKETIESKSMKIFETNKIFIINLKRFFDFRKNQTPIDIPEKLILDDVLINQVSYEKASYNLYAAILHMGSLRGGHYVAVCKNYRSEKWVKYNDQYIQQIQNFEKINFNDANAVFYSFCQTQSIKNKDPVKQSNVYVPKVTKEKMINVSPNDIKIEQIISKPVKPNYQLIYMVSVLECLLNFTYLSNQFKKPIYKQVQNKTSLIYIFHELLSSDPSNNYFNSCQKIRSILNKSGYRQFFNKKNYSIARQFLQHFLYELGQQINQIQLQLKQLTSLKFRFIQEETSVKYQVKWQCNRFSQSYPLSYQSCCQMNVVEGNNKLRSLKSCLQNFQNPNKQKHPRHQYCKFNNSYCKATRIKILNTNRLVIVELKRFANSIKQEHTIDIPIQLQVKQLIYQHYYKKYDNKAYFLVGVVCHEGGYYNRVFYSQIIDSETNSPRKSETIRYQKGNILSLPNAYILFYELKDK